MSYILASMDHSKCTPVACATASDRFCNRSGSPLQPPSPSSAALPPARPHANGRTFAPTPDRHPPEGVSPLLGGWLRTGIIRHPLPPPPFPAHPLPRVKPKPAGGRSCSTWRRFRRVCVRGTMAVDPFLCRGEIPPHCRRGRGFGGSSCPASARWAGDGHRGTGGTAEAGAGPQAADADLKYTKSATANRRFVTAGTWPPVACATASNRFCNRSGNPLQPPSPSSEALPPARPHANGRTFAPTPEFEHISLEFRTHSRYLPDGCWDRTHQVRAHRQDAAQSVPEGRRHRDVGHHEHAQPGAGGGGACFGHAAYDDVAHPFHVLQLHLVIE